MPALQGEAGKEAATPVACARTFLPCPDCDGVVGPSLPAHFLGVDGGPGGNHARGIFASSIATPETAAAV